jgi:hypothetical protein
MTTGGDSMATFHIDNDESVNKTIRMKISLINQITELATAHGISFNALVVQMAEFALQHLPDKDNVEPGKKSSEKN